jgi:4-hydroxy-tetrahydrodipicolinate synthase
MSQQSTHKQWAAENLKGIENQLIPSFTPDKEHLSEAGIRWDVRHQINQGFNSVMCTSEAGLTFEEAKRFVEIAADEAGDDICVSTTLLFNSLGKNREMLVHADEVGLDTVLLGYPFDWYPDSPEEVYELTREFCELVDLGIVLYPTSKYTFERFHPSGFPIGILDRLADVPNVVGLKISMSGSGNRLVGDEIFRMVGDRLQVTYPGGDVPGLVRKYDMQWICPGLYDVFQTPENPYMVEYFDHLLEGEYDEAMEIYWKLTPVREAFSGLMRPQAKLGNYHFPLFKYCQWLTGGNGGFTRQPTFELAEDSKRAIRGAMDEIELELRENEVEFYAGRANYNEENGNGIG